MSADGRWKMEDGKGQDGVEETGGKGVRGREGAEKVILSVLSKKGKESKEKGTTEPTVEVCGVREGRRRRRRRRRGRRGKKMAAVEQHEKKRPSTQGYSVYIYQHTINHVTFPKTLSLSASFHPILEVRKRTYFPIYKMQNAECGDIARVLTSWG